jgi:hypothetical protein
MAAGFLADNGFTPTPDGADDPDGWTGERVLT